MSDTINERPGFGETFGETDPPPPRRDPTGRQRIDREELEQLVARATDRAVAKRAPSQAKAIAALVIAALAGGGTTYGGQRIADVQDDARSQEQVRQIERRVAEHERRIEGIGEIGRDIAALSATLDGMAATNATANASTQQRLDRIENRLERLRR